MSLHIEFNENIENYHLEASCDPEHLEPVTRDFSYWNVWH